MALNFSLKDDSNENIEWSVFIDVDGDLTLMANDERILYIDSEDGALKRFTNLNTALGLKLDERGRIEVAN